MKNKLQRRRLLIKLNERFGNLTPSNWRIFMRTRQQPQLKQLQAGFTLIELIIVIVIIGILAAVAIPRFASLTDDAKIGVVKGAAGAAASAAAVNYAACKGSLTACKTMANCSDIKDLTQLPTTDYSIGDVALVKDTAAICTMTDGETTPHTATFTAYGL